MRVNVRRLVQLAESIFDIPEPIYEFGSFQVAQQEALSDLRRLFPQKEYVGCDIRPGKGVDRIENVESLTCSSESVGSVIFVDTIEHVEKPCLAIKEIFRALKPTGLLIMASAMDFPIHNHPHDYWRFSPQGLKLLLSAFRASIVGFQGYTQHPHMVFAIGVKARPENIFSLWGEFSSRVSAEVRPGWTVAPYKRRLAGLVAKHLFKRGGIHSILIKYSFWEEIGCELIEQ